MTREDFYDNTYKGYYFTLKGDKYNYIFGNRKENQVDILWYEEEENYAHTSVYFLSDVLSNIDTGTWILEKKFYRLKKLERIIEDGYISK